MGKQKQWYSCRFIKEIKKILFLCVHVFNEDLLMSEEWRLRVEE